MKIKKRQTMAMSGIKAVFRAAGAVAIFLLLFAGMANWRVVTELRKEQRLLHANNAARIEKTRAYITKVNPKANAPLIAEALASCAVESGVRLEYLIALAHVESNFDQFAVSNRKAHGLMQLMRATAESEGMSWEKVFDPHTNVCTSARFLNTLASRKGATPEAILNWYNGGDPRFIPETQRRLLQVVSHFNG